MGRCCQRSSKRNSLEVNNATTVTGIETDFCNTYLDGTTRRELAQCERRKLDNQATKTEKKNRVNMQVTMVAKEAVALYSYLHCHCHRYGAL